ncbi:MAG TPA: hypothetical protein VNO24_08390 [Blastocatellia bacterium]|nr:hypothetical protein [Blastocatellia bacterium]
MKKMSLKAISGVALTVILLLAASQIPASGQNGKASRIEGTWRVALTIRNCQTGAELATAQGLNTFIPGGSMIGTPSQNPALLRAGHGVWEHTGGQSFTNTVIFFRYAPDGTFAGTQKVTRQIEVAHAGDEFTSTDTFELADPNGNVVGGGCATGAGQRLE